MREAATKAGLSRAGKISVMTAVSASMQGAQIVDFANPDQAPTSSPDGIITGLEVDRTPSVVGQTSRTLLRYASAF